jgi:hypothetical protein
MHQSHLSKKLPMMAMLAYEEEVDRPVWLRLDVHVGSPGMQHSCYIIHSKKKPQAQKCLARTRVETRIYSLLRGCSVSIDASESCRRATDERSAYEPGTNQALFDQAQGARQHSHQRCCMFILPCCLKSHRIRNGFSSRGRLYIRAGSSSS